MNCASFAVYGNELLAAVSIQNFKTGLWPLFQRRTLRSKTKFLATESLLKKMKNNIYFTLKDLFVLEIFKFMS